MKNSDAYILLSITIYGYDSHFKVKCKWFKNKNIYIYDGMINSGLCSIVSSNEENFNPKLNKKSQHIACMALNLKK